MHTVVVGTARKYRFNTYLFPTVDCVIEVYAKSGRPARYVELLKCLEEEHGIRGKRSLDSGLGAGIENDYIKAVPVGGRSGYEPRTNGVVHTAIYMALRDVIGDVPPHMLPHLIECVRTSLVLALVPQLTQGMPDHELFRFLLKRFDNALGKSGSELKLLDMRNVMLGYYIALKMLAGNEIKHLKPKYYVHVEAIIRAEVKAKIMMQWLPPPRPGLMRLFIDACRNSASRITAMTR
jgi:hypothetical protein